MEKVVRLKQRSFADLGNRRSFKTQWCLYLWWLISDMLALGSWGNDRTMLLNR